MKTPVFASLNWLVMNVSGSAWVMLKLLFVVSNPVCNRFGVKVSVALAAHWTASAGFCMVMDHAFDPAIPEMV